MARRSLLILACLWLTGCGAAAPALAPAAPEGARAQGLFNKPVATAWLLADTLAKYDHNRNGSLELQRPEGLLAGILWADERLRHETTRRVERDRTGAGTKIVYVTYTYSRRDLFYAADADHNARVLSDELEAVVTGFDQDGDGLLTRRGFMGWLRRKDKGEHDLLQARYGEQLVSTRRRELQIGDRAGQAAVEAEGPLVETPTATETLRL